MRRPRRLLSLAHHYVVSQYRRLAHEIARQGAGSWEVTAVAPPFFQDSLGPLRLESGPSEECRLEKIPVRFSRCAPLMFYGSRLRGLLAQGWDLVHLSEEPYILAGGQAAFSTPRGIPLVFRTGRAVSKNFPPPFSWIENYCLERCSGWIGTRSVIEAMLGRGYGRRPYREIPLGVDTEAFRPWPQAREEMRRRLGLPLAGPPLIGFVGRFVPEKGLGLLMRALERLTSPWQALFVGEGVLEGDLRLWAGQRPDRVRVLTGVRHGEMASTLNAIDILCLPSQTGPRWRESFGRVLIEAFACGVCVVGSDSGEIPHVIADAGLVLGERDEDGWVEALDSLLESPRRRLALGMNGLEAARSRYAWPIVARQHLEFFEQILERDS